MRYREGLDPVLKVTAAAAEDCFKTCFTKSQATKKAAMAPGLGHVGAYDA